MNIYQQIHSNNRNTWLILSIFAALFIFLGFGADYLYGVSVRMPIFTVLALIVAIALSFSGYMYGDRMILASTHARGPDQGDNKEKQWCDVVEEMHIASGIPMPKVYVIDDPDPNAFATGRDPRHSSIAATRGLLDALNRDELQAVASHEMSHIRNYDIRLMLIVGVLVGAVALLSDWGARMLFRRGRRSSSGNSGGGGLALIVLVIWLVTIILAPILSQLIALCVSRKREYLADASGAELTRNPLALASALEKISSYTGPTTSINQGTAHLCIEDPKGNSINQKEGWFANLLATHPPISKRIAALKEMAYQGS